MRLFLSSVEGSQIDSRIANRSKFILCSYAYLRKAIKNQPWIIELMIEKNKQDCFILDSGAFTFMNGSKPELDKLTEYCVEYMNFVKKYHIKRYVEMDIDNVFGTPQAMKYRHYLESNIGYKPIPIWHRKRGIDSFKKDVHDYDYIGIGGLAIKTIKQSEYHKLKLLNGYAKAHGTKVHEMGFTPSRDANSFGFYSTDSSSWSTALRFGTIRHFDGHGMEYIKGKRFKRAKGNDYIKILHYEFIEWIKYQEFLLKE